MNDRAQELASKLIRNFNEATMKPEVRAPKFESLCAALARDTAAQKLGISIDIVPPGKRACPYHFHHAQEEMFIVLEGEGTLRVAGEMLPIKAGDIAFIPPGPDYPHHILNTSDAPLKYLSISTRDYPEICEYPDSDKYLAYTKDGAFHGLQRVANNLDYWDGED